MTVAKTYDLSRSDEVELYGRDKLRESKRISNPGCYATNTQLLLAPLMPLLDLSQPPTVFGISGYSGAGTKSGEKDAEGRPKTVAKVVSCHWHHDVWVELTIRVHQTSKVAFDHTA